jgi:hypothetical protein
MTLDTLDHAFVARWERRMAAGVQVATPDAEPVTAGPDSSAAGEPGERRPETDDAPPAPLPPLADSRLVQRLLAAGRDAWAALAAEVEAARLAGHRVIAVTGGERGEGRSTLVACLAETLIGRGRDVVVLASTAELAAELAADRAAPVAGGRLHDKRIVLIDAGVWFLPGPIRRHRLLVSSLGCDAAILVRRADREPAASWASALAAVGVTPLGEVVTFAAPSSSPSESC